MAKLGALNALVEGLVHSTRLPKTGVVPAVKYNNQTFLGRQHSDALDKLVATHPDVSERQVQLGYYSRLKDVFLPLEDGKKYDPRWPNLKKQKGIADALDEADIPDNLYGR